LAKHSVDSLAGLYWKLPDRQHDGYRFIEHLVNLLFVISAQNGAEFLVSNRRDRQGLLTLKIRDKSLAEVVNIGRMVTVFHDFCATKLGCGRPGYPVENFLGLGANRLVKVAFADVIGSAIPLSFRERLFEPPQGLVDGIGQVSGFINKREHHFPNAGTGQ
jgi:hypothetical protein